MSAAPHKTFRAARSYAVLGAVFGGLFAVTVYATIFADESFWRAAATFGAAFLLVILWLAALEIRITEDELVFRSLFGGVRRARLSDIRRVRVGFDLGKHGGPLRLIVELRDRSLPTMSINEKVFTLEAIRAVLDLAEDGGTEDSRELDEGVVKRAV